MRHPAWKLFGLLAITLATATQAHAEVRVGFAAALTGPMAWAGAASEQGAQFGVADLNAGGGVLGEQIELITADDYCDGEQAVAAANKLVAVAVVVVVGHQCSGAAIPASKVYSQTGLLMISTFATNPKLTEQGFSNVFRVVGRDDLQGRMAGDLLAEHWANKPIAILHDGQAYGQGLAEEAKKRLNERGFTAAIFEAIEPGKADYWDVVQKMRAMDIQVLYYGGYRHEAGLIVRQAREHGYQLHLVGGDGIGGEDFGLVAGPASDGTLMTAPPMPSGPGAAELAWKLTEHSKNAFTAYAALQAWAQAVEMAGTFETEAVAKNLRAQKFDTVLGRIGFDQKGDVTGYDTFVWHVWKDGQDMPVDPAKLTE